MSDDITFCGSECNNTRCHRHRSNIKEPNIPHSFAYFKDTVMCPMSDKLCKHYKPVTDGKYDFSCEYYNAPICGDCSDCEYYEVANKQEVRLIDANALIKKLKSDFDDSDVYTDKDQFIVDCVHLLDNAPTVTVEDWVRDMPLDDINLLYKTLTPHGFWIRKPVERDLLYNTGIKFTCPFCGEGNSYGEPPHCMYCGARLDKEVRNESN